MTLLVEQDEAPDPIHIGSFRTQAIMAITQLFPYLIEQARLCHPAVGVILADFGVLTMKVVWILNWL
jgi:hypothetical protein